MKFHSIPTSGIIPSTPAAWPTSNILAIATGRIVRIHTVDSLSAAGELVAILEGHTASITVVLSLPGMRIASASLDGTIRIWDVTTGHCLRTLDLTNPILHMAYTHPDQLLCLTSNELLHVRLTRNRSKRRRKLVRKLFSNVLNKPSRVVASENGSVVAVSDSTNIHLMALENGGVTTTLRCRRVISALAITRDGSVLAAADEAGIISLYHKPEKILAIKRTLVPWEKAAPAQLHWHASAPQALTFAHDDSVLISAGSEAVLVTWRLTPALLGTRTFLPRLRSAIFALSVSPNERTYAISQADNAVRLIDQLSSKAFRGIQAVPARLLDFSQENSEADLSSRVNPNFINMCSLTADPLRPGRLWFGGTGSSIQLFDMFNNTSGEILDIAPRNAVYTASDKGKHMNESSGVSGVAMHDSGRFLATANYQALHSSRSERYSTERAAHSLKFWYRESPEKEFVLSATVSQPHGPDCSISSLCFHPSIPLLVTTSRASRTFTLWRATRRDDSEDIRWRKEIELDYKEMACNDACFSSDGSILFVACEHVLTMWKVDNLFATSPHKQEGPKESKVLKFCPESFPISVQIEFLHVLVHPPREEQIVSIAYIYTSVPLVISVTRNGIYAWHALSQSIWWSTRIRSASKRLAFDSDSGRFALQLCVPSIGAEGEGRDGDVHQQSPDDEAMNQTRPCDNVTQVPPIKAPNENGPLAPNEQALNMRHETTGRKGNSQTHTPCKRKGLGQLASDAAVAIFDAGSPIPLHVHRLASEAKVTALAFVKSTEQMDRSLSTLVFVDSNMEMFLYGSRTNVAIMGQTMRDKELKLEGSAPTSKLKSIIPMEDDVHPSGDAGLSRGSCNVLPYAIEKAFHRYFDGPTHIQAPASVNSFDFIKTLLADSPSARTDKNEEALYKGSLRNRKELREHHPNSDYETVQHEGYSKAEDLPSHDDFVPADYELMRAFCVSVVKKSLVPSK